MADPQGTNPPSDDFDLSMPEQAPAFADLSELGLTDSAEAAPSDVAFDPEAAMEELAAEGHTATETMAGVEGDEELPVEAEEEEDEGEPLEEQPKKTSVMFVLLEILGLIALAAGGYALVDHYQLSPLHWAYGLVLVLIAYILWKTRRKWTEPEASAMYTVILAVCLVSTATAAYFLSMELSAYDWDWKGRNAKMQAGQDAIQTKDMMDRLQHEGKLHEAMRGRIKLEAAIQIYRLQHEGKYPALARFREQMLGSTNAKGKVGDGAGFPLGPYLQDQRHQEQNYFAENPFTKSRNLVEVPAPGKVPSAEVPGDAGWLYDESNGTIYPNKTECLKSLQ